MPYSALIIGCGNIGALYDLNVPERVWTHAKVFSITKDIRFSVADANSQQVNKVAAKYKTSVIALTDKTDFSEFDIVSITSPTATHFGWLKKMLQLNIPLIICEKPVAANRKELNELNRLYKKSTSKVLVNYIRRFQPAYEKLKKQLAKKRAAETCKGINIKYQRGFLNNGGHAFDLVEYLFDTPFTFDQFKIVNAVYDAFTNDPTISGSCSFIKIPVTVLGIVNAEYAVFEIELFFTNSKIVICHTGDEIRFYKRNKDQRLLVEDKKIRHTNILSKYMVSVKDKGLQLLKLKDEKDNFLQAVELNKRIVQIIATVNNKNT